MTSHPKILGNSPSWTFVNCPKIVGLVSFVGISEVLDCPAPLIRIAKAGVSGTWLKNTHRLR